MSNVREARWQSFKCALEKFVKREGHANVPQKHCEGEYKLGQGVRHVRSRGQFVKNRPERRALLSDMGFLWSKKGKKVRKEDGRWALFKKAITQFCEREKHCLVNIKHVEKVTLNDGTTLNYNLGQQVSEVRNTHQHVKGDTERKKWLTELGFVWILRGSAHDFYEMKGGGEEQGSTKPALKI